MLILPCSVSVGTAAAEQLHKGGDWMPLVGQSGSTWGAALRSTDTTTNPIFVSVGHRVSLATACALAARCCQFRVPEPVRQADQRSREFLRQHPPH